MSREDWICVAIIISGIILFLIGANIYNAFIGFLGLFLFIGGILALVALYIYNTLERRRQKQEQAQGQVPPQAQNP